MFKNLKWLRLTPDRPGRGGHKAAIHSFQQEPVNDIRELYNAYVYRGAWVREYDPYLYPSPQTQDNNSQNPLVVHGYVWPSLTDPAAQPSVTVMTQHDNGTNTRVWDYNAGTLRASRPLSTNPGSFQNIAGRCFYGEGAAEAMVFDDRTPAIHAQPNQSLGISAPSQPLQKAVGNGITPYGTGYCYNGSSYINHPNPNNPIGNILATDTVNIDTPDVDFGQYGGVAIVAASPTGNAVTSNTLAFTATGTISIDPAVNPSLVTLAGATWPAGYAYCGLSINFNGLSYVIAEHGVHAGPTAYTIDGTARTLTNVQLLILGTYDGPALTNVAYTITGCQVTMPGGASTLKMVTTGTAGYSQTTQSNLVQVRLFVVQANTLFRNLGNISLGPATRNTVTTTTGAFMGTNSPTVVDAAGGFLATDVGKQIIVDGAVPANGLLISSIVIFNNNHSVTLGSINTSGGTLTGKKAMWANAFQGVSDAVMDNNVTFNLTSASNPWTQTNVGDTIMIAGASAGPVALLTTITGYVGPGQVTVGHKNTSGGAIATKQAYWFDPLSGATPGPTYAYAWYDPETGHCSNISPLFQIPVPAITGSYENFANLTPQFQIDPGYISYPNGISSTTVNAGTDAARFSHILFFRTLSTPGSSTLYPIGSLNPFVGKVHPGAASTRGSWNPPIYHGWMGLPTTYTPTPPNVASTPPNYWYDWSSDSDLLLSGGFRAPQETNGKPMVLLRGGAIQPGYPFVMAYWDRRLWLVNTQAPDTIVFSCDEAQCPLGVPEESFPPTNFLRIPTVDGRVMGMKTVGSTLLVTTERWAYVVVGNNESNYRLMKISASMPGVGTHQMDEFPTLTGAEGEATTLFYFGRDGNVYQWTMGGPAVPINFPLGTFSSDLYTYQNSRLHCVSAYGRRLVVLGPYTGGGYQAGGLPTMIYDIDNRVWSVTGRLDGSNGIVSGTAPMTTIYGLDPPVNELYAIHSSTYGKVLVGGWLSNLVAQAHLFMDVITFPLNFDGRKTRKQLVSVNIHASDGLWEFLVVLNESQMATYSGSFGAYLDPLYSIYGAPPVAPVEGTGTQDIVVMSAQFAGDRPLVGYRFQISVRKGAASGGGDINPAKLYAIDIGYIDYEEQAEGDP